jgi:sulfur carrier protein
VAALPLPRGPTAVEVNRVLVPRSQHASRVLAEGDAIEVVTLVGGG